MDNMFSLLGEHRPCLLFRELFLRQLPEHVRTPLAISDTQDYLRLAQEADKLFLSANQPTSLLDTPVNAAQCSEVEQHIDAACWYHRKLGDKAKKCLPPCQHKKKQGNARAGQQTNQAYLIIADIQRPLLGADFFRRHNLLVDLRGHRLIEADTYLSSPCSISRVATTELALIEQESNKFRKVLQDFPALLQPTFSSTAVKHGVQHHMPTTGPPVHSGARRLAPDKVAVAKKEFMEMEQIGIIRKSNSPWASPLHIVPKPNGGWRPCRDDRCLNNATTPDRYLIPHIQNFLRSWPGKQSFQRLI
ncbi:transposon Ty3-G Gag-Pol polyprotein [Elysia marginata]|uniref:Transposon Ty3-G Gag-Pol polyprotein n=1 Tax=Elysia marginata TaxID=1093978 RepID=A0AAV4F8E0_9GAST|nr:transposon Ty3-G Gag-Pol polyprotein [Elysia marginata]